MKEWKYTQVPKDTEHEARLALTLLGEAAGLLVQVEEDYGLKGVGEWLKCYRDFLRLMAPRFITTKTEVEGEK